MRKPLRAGVKKLAQHLGVATQLRDLRGVFESGLMKRDRLAHEHTRLLLAFTLSTDSNCVDVGACKGSVLSEMVRLAPQGRHIAYEPIPEKSEQLARRFPQVDVRCAALSNRTGEADFIHVRSNPGYSGFRVISYPGSEDLETIRVRVEELDLSLPAEFELALIKIDVEGAEQQVLEGAIRTIADCRPTVIFEHGSGADYYGTCSSDIFDLLCVQAGLRIFDIEGKGPLGRGEFEDRVQGGEVCNFVAHT
jgi:FkbM family methyltransferase